MVTAPASTGAPWRSRLQGAWLPSDGGGAGGIPAARGVSNTTISAPRGAL